MRIKFVNVIALVVLVLNLSPVWAMESMPGMDHRSMQGGSAPPDARDPNAYADGYDSGPHALHLSGHHKFGAVLVDSLELVDTSDNSSAADNGTLQDASTELLWGHAVAAYWDAQLGVRYDSGVDPSRGWLALGLQGLAPYWFELDTTAYFGDAGRSALRLKAEYELLFTQKLILQPRLEANFYGQSDPARGLGAGLSDLEVGLRLRYEIRREFAPYLGIVWTGKYGGTADDAQAAGENTKETQLVAGLRLWF
jgi:copper resistance protein B